MQKKFTPSFIFWLILAKISILGIDQFLKYLSVSQQHDFFIWAKKLGFVFNINPDIAFNIQIPRYGFIISVTIFFALFIWQYVFAWRAKEKLLIWGYALFIIGALSNLIDRVIYGYVVDYLYFAPVSYLNLADIAIVVGALMFGGQILYGRLRGLFKRKKPKSVVRKNTP